MEPKEIEMRITATEEKIEKRLANNEKLKAKIAKLAPDTFPRCRYERDVMESEKKLADLNRVLNNWKARLGKAVAKKDSYNSLPPVLLALENELNIRWLEEEKGLNEYAEQLYKEYVEDKASDSHERYKLTKAFINAYGQAMWERAMHPMTGAELEKAVKDSARYYVLDLAFRVKKYVGNVVDWSNIIFNGKALNGVVIGENGKCRLKTISAEGPYRRYHLRVLVHKA